VSPGPTSSTPTRRLAEQGDLLARRYRLLRPLPGPPDAVADLWQATDEVLARPVAVRILATRNKQALAFLQAAARSAAVATRPLTRVYDAAVEPCHDRPSLTYVVSEWIDGEPLADVLAAGPLPVAEALNLAVQVTAALVDVHAAGGVHGRLHPGNILITPDGDLRLTDTEVAAALHGTRRASTTTEGPDRTAPSDASPADDVRDLSALLYAMVTGRWPDRVSDQPARGLPPAPRNDHGVCRPRQVRAGVPRALDATVVRALDASRRSGPPLDTAAALLVALETAARGVHRQARQAQSRRPPRPRLLRRLGPRTGLAALLVVLGTTSFSLGLSLGEVPPPGGLPVAPAALRDPGAPGPVDLATAVVRVQDPSGTPHEDAPDQVGNAYDADPSTAWVTQRYPTERFGGRQPGVGLLVDLGAPTALSEVAVALTRAGTGLELRAADALGADPTVLPVVARDDGGARVVELGVPPGTSARYWLIWITRLPPDGDQYRAGIDELRLLRR